MRSVSQQIKKFWRQGGGSSECSFFWDLDGGLLVDVDTIQELSLVLLANFADLSGESASEGDSVDVDSVNNHLVLNVVGHGDLDSWVDLDGVRLGSSQIVLHLEFSSVILDNWLDGEMSVYKSHFISEAEGDSGDHVCDVRLNSGNCAALLILSEPHRDLDVLSFIFFGVEVDNFNFAWDVAEVSLQFSSLSFNSNLSGFDLNSDVVWDCDPILLQKSSHIANIFYYIN